MLPVSIGPLSQIQSSEFKASAFLMSYVIKKMLSQIGLYFGEGGGEVFGHKE